MGAVLGVERGVLVPWRDERRPFHRFTEIINDIRKKHPKGSVYERAAKEIGNTLYGKVAQGINLLKSPDGAGKAGGHGKRVFDSRKGEMTTLPPSSISNAALAAFTTGLGRAYLSELLAAVPPEKAIYTATTDGLLTESTLTELEDTGPLATMTLEQCAAVTGYSPSQLSRITCSPEFRRRFRTAIDRAQLDAVSRFMLERSKYYAELRPRRRPFEP